MSLKLTIGESSIIGPRERNEDYVGLVLPTDAQLATKGALLAVADGIGGNAGGREAAEMTVRTVCADYTCLIRHRHHSSKPLGTLASSN